jgi:2-haloacid dehalogenase
VSTDPAARPSAVVFDLGNVLIRWDPLPAIAAGVGEQEAQRFLAADDFDFLAWNHVQDLGRGWAEAEDEVAVTHPHWHRHARAYREHFDLCLLGPVEENVAVLRDLAAADVPLFALTNWSSELFPRALARYDYLGLFTDIVVSGDEGVGKPDPAVFALLGERMGRPLTGCVFIDDSATNVTAASAAGLDAIRYTGHATGHPTGDTALRPALRERGLPV